MTFGWLFDVYPLGNKMIIWIKQENGDNVRLEDNGWSHSIYVASNNYTDLLKSIQKDESIRSLIKECQFTSSCCYEGIIDVTKSSIMKLTLLDPTKALTLARKIETLESSKFGKYRIYNVNLLPTQSYFYEHNIFPLALCKVDNHFSNLRWLNKDSVWSADYKIPDFKTISLTLNLSKEAKIPRYTDKIDSIYIRQIGEEEEQKEEELYEIHSE
jgi:DNA polymerase, archaea type